jgi:hypothetical protein
MDIMIHNKRNLSTSLFLILGATTLMQSSTVIPVSAQNTSNSLTESEPLGIITITVQQLKELENSMSDIRQALEQSSTESYFNLEEFCCNFWLSLITNLCYMQSTT